MEARGATPPFHLEPLGATFGGGSWLSDAGGGEGVPAPERIPTPVPGGVDALGLAGAAFAASPPRMFDPGCWTPDLPAPLATPFCFCAAATAAWAFEVAFFVPVLPA